MDIYIDKNEIFADAYLIKALVTFYVCISVTMHHLILHLVLKWVKICIYVNA